VGDRDRDHKVSDLVVLPIGRVQATGRPKQAWAVLDADGVEIDAVSQWLTELAASDYSPGTLRSYAYDLLAWYRLLDAMHVGWTGATRADVRDVVRWYRMADNPQRRRSGTGQPGRRPPAGSVNPRTAKPYLRNEYAPATIDHLLSVVSEFYEFAVATGLGPLSNPVPRSPTRRTRELRTRQGPMEAPQPQRRARYRQKREQRAPRAISDELFNEFFAQLPTVRDRAIVSTSVSSGARAAEMLSMRPCGVQVDSHTVEVIGKGRREYQPVRTSPDSLMWISLYLADRPSGFGPADPLWLTLRGQPRPMTYWSLRQVLERANTALGTNITFHDLRHTYAYRLATDPSLLITDVQELMRHASLSTTQVYLRTRTEDLVERLLAHYARPPAPPPRPAAGYDPADLAVLFGHDTVTGPNA